MAAFLVALASSSCRVFGVADVPCTADEQCDDGETCNDGVCGPGAPFAGDDDDDAGVDAGSAPVVCGDGRVGVGEACDDGDGDGGDGCSSSCAVEAGFACGGAPSVCASTADAVTVCAQGCDATTIDDALAGAPAPGGAPRTVFLDDGEHEGPVHVDGIEAALVGAPGARIVNDAVGEATIDVRGGASLRVVGIVVGGATAGAALIVDEGATVVVERCAIGPGAGAGIYGAAGTRVDVLASTIAGNQGGGATIFGGGSWESALVVDNGGADSFVAGLSFARGDGEVFVRACTIAGNRARAGVEAVQCSAALTLDGSIVYESSGPSLSSQCSARRSDVFGRADAGFDVIDVDPRFVDSAGGDWHLAAASPCIDALGPDAGLPTVDVDGELRPRGAGWDMGADER